MDQLSLKKINLIVLRLLDLNTIVLKFIFHKKIYCFRIGFIIEMLSKIPNF